MCGSFYGLAWVLNIGEKSVQDWSDGFTCVVVGLLTLRVK